MTKWIAVTVLALASVYAPPAAAQQDNVAPHECDRLAASPVDPDRKGDGVAFGEIKPAAAIAACRAALASFPKTLRFQYQLARALQAGHEIKEAFGQYKTAAEAGHPVAAHNFAHFYLDGLGTDKNPAEALRWYRFAAERGFAMSMVQIGAAYESGIGVAKDLTEALSWYRKAAAAGNDEARELVRKLEPSVAAAAPKTPDRVPDCKDGSTATASGTIFYRTADHRTMSLAIHGDGPCANVTIKLPVDRIPPACVVGRKVQATGRVKSAVMLMVMEADSIQCEPRSGGAAEGRNAVQASFACGGPNADIELQTSRTIATLSIHEHSAAQTLRGILNASIVLATRMPANSGEATRTEYTFHQVKDGSVSQTGHRNRKDFSRAAWTNLQTAAHKLADKARDVSKALCAGLGKDVLIERSGDHSDIRDLVGDLQQLERLATPPVGISGSSNPFSPDFAHEAVSVLKSEARCGLGTELWFQTDDYAATIYVSHDDQGKVLNASLSLAASMAAMMTLAPPEEKIEFKLRQDAAGATSEVSHRRQGEFAPATWTAIQRAAHAILNKARDLPRDFAGAQCIQNGQRVAKRLMPDDPFVQALMKDVQQFQRMAMPAGAPRAPGQQGSVVTPLPDASVASSDCKQGSTVTISGTISRRSIDGTKTRLSLTPATSACVNWIDASAEKISAACIVGERVQATGRVYYSLNASGLTADSVACGNAPAQSAQALTQQDNALGQGTPAVVQQDNVELHDCDRLAASPLDAGRKGAGVPFGEIRVAPAIGACRAALASFPKTARFQYQLARALQAGQQNAEAFPLYKAAAEAGHVAAAHNLGLSYTYGDGTQSNQAEALRWYRFAAARGFATSMLQVGRAYESGAGVPKDLNEALSWYRKAVAAGNEEARDVVRKLEAAVATAPSKTPGAPSDCRIGSTVTINGTIFRRSADSPNPREVWLYLSLGTCVASIVSPASKASVECISGERVQATGRVVGGLLGQYLEATSVECSKAPARPEANAAIAGPVIPDGPQVHDCDRLAASPYDPLRKARGLWIKETDSAKAVSACRSALTQYPDAVRFQYQLGRALKAGKQNPEEVVALYRKAADAGYPPAMTGLGWEFWLGAQQGAGVKRDREESFRLWRQAADLGDPGAMNYLGEFGRDISWYLKAAELGHASGMMSLAAIYEEARDSEKSKERALHWYRRAADAGDLSAIKTLSGYAATWNERRDWLARAVKSGDSDAAVRLARSFERGPDDLGATQAQRAPKDYVEAAYWMRVAMEMGDRGAMSSYAYYLEKGIGVATNDAEAFRLRLKLAEGGSVEAISLARALVFGQGTAPNHSEAIRWLFVVVKGGVDLGFSIRTQTPPWPAAFVRAMQARLKSEGVFPYPIDGKVDDRLETAFTMLAQAAQAAEDAKRAAEDAKRKEQKRPSSLLEDAIDLLGR